MILKLLKSTFSLPIILLASLISTAYGADFVVGISDLSITPSTIYAGDKITVTASYSVSSSASAKVRLELLFDGVAVDSFTQYRSTGTYETEFDYTPSDSKTGSRNIGIRARIYDGDILKDEDTITRNVQIYPGETDHALEITSIAAQKTAKPSERFPVTINIANKGSWRENNIYFSAKIDGKTYFASTTSLDHGESATKTIYITAPSGSGTYDIFLNVYNSYASASEKITVDVQTNSLSLTLKKTSAEAGEWVDIYGYATRGNYASESYVSSYIDGVYSGMLPTRENGYYSTKYRFETPGSHKITVFGGGLTTSQYVYISAPQAAPYIAPEPAKAAIIIPEGNYTAIVVVTGEGQYTVYPKAKPQEPAPQNMSENADKYLNYSFVNIDTSAKELDIVKNSGNLLKITVSNHLGKSDIFSVSTSFEPKWTYIPGSEVVEDGKKHLFEIYFTPDRAGRFSGEVYVKQANTTIKTIPISLFVAPRDAAAAKEALPFALDASAISILAILFLSTLVVLLLGSKRTKALEPKLMPSQSKDVSDILKTMSSPFSKAPETQNQGIFYAPRNKIII